MILNACFLSYSNLNVGEAFTQPVDYFNMASAVKKVPLSVGRHEAFAADIEMVIVGGGGIVTTRHKNAWLEVKAVADWVPQEIPLVIWGAGINDHGRLDRRYDETLSNLESRPNVMVGLRDSFYAQHVPCVSCMREEFDTAYTIRHGIGLYMHHAARFTGHFPLVPDAVMTNAIQGEPVSYFRRVLRFLGSCEVVITNTYHGAYWATLLKRKVIVVSPFSNKFVGFKHEPVIVQDIGLVPHAMMRARCYPEALDDSRSANLAFFHRVRAFKQAHQR